MASLFCKDENRQLSVKKKENSFFRGDLVGWFLDLNEDSREVHPVLCDNLDVGDRVGVGWSF